MWSTPSFSCLYIYPFHSSKKLPFFATDCHCCLHSTEENSVLYVFFKVLIFIALYLCHIRSERDSGVEREKKNWRKENMSLGVDHFISSRCQLRLSWSWYFSFLFHFILFWRRWDGFKSTLKVLNFEFFNVKTLET